MVCNEIVTIWQQRRKTTELRVPRSIVRSIKLLYSRYSNLRRSAARLNRRESQKPAAFDVEINNEFDITLERREESEGFSFERDSSESTEVTEANSSFGSEISERGDSAYEPSRRSHTRKKFRITPDLVRSLDHGGLSNPKATSVILSTAKYLGINPSSVTISQSTLPSSHKNSRPNKL